MPAGIDDTATLRWALRSDGSAGFVFLTWHQPHIPLGTYRAAQFEVTLDGGPVTFPEVPVDVPTGTIAHWPVNLEVAGVTLEWATASPLTVLEPAPDAPGGVPTLVLAAEAGIPVELRFAPGTEVGGPAVSGPGRPQRLAVSEPVVLTAQHGDAVLDVLLLPAGLADQAWVLDGGRDLVFSTGPLWLDGDGLLAGRSQGEPAVGRYHPGTRSIEGVEIPPKGTNQRERSIEARLVRPSRPVPASYGEAAHRAAAPEPEMIDGLAQAYTLVLPADAFGAASELEIHWAGDVARILVDGVAVADRFWDGSPWVLNVADCGIGPGADVVLQILPLSPQAKVGLPAEAQQRREAVPGDLLALDAVRLITWTGWQEKAGPSVA
jgi:hypothetical protein